MMSAKNFAAQLMAAEQSGILPAFLTQHFGSQGGTFGLLAWEVRDLLERDQDAIIRRLNDALPDSFAPAFILRYAMACLAAKADDVAETHRQLCLAVRIGVTGVNLFGQDAVAKKLLYSSIQQAFAIDPDDPLWQ